MEAALRNEVHPDGPLEDIAFQRLITATWQIEKCRQREAALQAFEPNEQNEANLQKVHRYYLRWEGSYNSAFRQLRLLQTDRGCIAYNNGKVPDTLGPLTDLPKIEQFARRIAKQFTFDDQVRKQLATLTVANRTPSVSAVANPLYPHHINNLRDEISHPAPSRP